ncbi:unnamed protein product [Acanthoscelides obtectus]|uniref:Uncharacterized protein n=1 Tax=Acanthoscelides obtectus TaxID=200917 RepID=A0A9P0KG21_ACAOB|nr:unnamed protein product [Acanthoscelides obtectus]CAK1635229.1 hypothetical protein AOBTE_LOCUS9145 [Acanthoscelides obtectus]
MIEHPIKDQGHSKTKKLFILIALIGATVTIVNYHNLYQKKLDVKRFQYSASRNIPPFPAKYHRGFLVSSSKCKIIDLDPFNDEAMQFHSAKRYQNCTKRQLLTYVTKEDNVATLHINTSLQSAYSLKNIRCCYSNIIRDSDGEYPDTTINISMCQEFTNSVLISQDPVMVNCIDDDGLIYENVHIAVTMTKSIEDKITKSKKRRPISLLMIGIDSVSRLNFIRTMPHTYNYVETNHWIPLLGFNKKGDNTFPNMMAILTGLDVSLLMEDKICNPYIFGELDTCPMIWKNYSKLGYITAYAEDEPYRVAFNYAKGFKTPPTDYYFKPYVLATQKLSKGYTYIDGLSYCTGPETAGERIMNLANDFSATFKSYPYLGLFG